MDTDLFLVIGIVLGGLAIPSMLNAYSEGAPPRFAAMLAIAAGALIVLAVTNSPVGYKMEDIPDVFTRVAARFM